MRILPLRLATILMAASLGVELEFHFKVVSEKTIERVRELVSINGSGPIAVDTGITKRHGEGIFGWFARVISKNQIVGVVRSAAQYKALAGQPNPMADNN